MASTTFTSGTVVTKDWLNGVNQVAYGASAQTPDNLFWPDLNSNTQMHRMQGRLFILEGVEFTGNRSGTQSGFIPTSTQGANWAPRDSALFVASDQGRMMVTGFASNANMDLTGGEPTETIGVAGFVIGNQTGRSVWGLYSDVQYAGGLSGWGVEFAIKNVSGVDTTATPDFFASGACGVWLVAGGDPTYGGAATNPSNFAVGIGGSGGANATWNKGIIVFEDGLTRDGSGYATALEMSLKHRVLWRNGSNNIAFDIRSEVTSATGNVAMVASNNAVTMVGTGGATIGQFAHQTNGVNFLQVANGANGSPVTLTAAIGGTDTNLDLRFITQGTGVLRFGTHTGNADAPITGYITIKDSGGTTRKLAVIS